MKQAATILTFKHPLLRAVCKEFDRPEGRHLIQIAMERVLEEYSAIGVAANQVGYNTRIIAIRVEHSIDKDIRFFINPVIINTEKKIVSEEGCLSIPGCYGDVERAGKVIISHYNPLMNRTVEETFIGRDAIVIQHEIDHLDGILFTDKAINLRYEKP